MIPYTKLINNIAESTSGEGVFVRPGLEAVGLKSGYSRFPSRDEAVTNEISDGFKKLLNP